jgi:hypothetical protein
MDDQQQQEGVAYSEWARDLLEAVFRRAQVGDADPIKLTVSLAGAVNFMLGEIARDASNPDEIKQKILIESFDKGFNKT